MLIKNLEENLKMKNVSQSLTPEKVGRITHIIQHIANDLKEFLGHLNHISAYVNSQNAPFYQALSQLPVLAINLEIIATITATIIVTMRNWSPILATFVLISTVLNRSNS